MMLQNKKTIDDMLAQYQKLSAIEKQRFLVAATHADGHDDSGGDQDYHCDTHEDGA